MGVGVDVGRHVLLGWLWFPPTVSHHRASAFCLVCRYKLKCTCRARRSDTLLLSFGTALILPRRYLAVEVPEHKKNLCKSNTGRENDHPARRPNCDLQQNVHDNMSNLHTELTNNWFSTVCVFVVCLLSSIPSSNTGV